MESSKDRPDAKSPARVARHLITALEREIHRLSGEALRPLGLTPPQAEVLTVLSVRSPLTLTALGERLLCEAGSPSRLVERMVRRGWLQRRRAPHDGRAVWITPTAEGRALMPRIAEAEATVQGALDTLLGQAPLEDFNRALWQGLASRPPGKVLRRRNAEGSL